MQISLINRHRQFIKFLLVGGLNTLVGYLLYAIFIYMGMHYSLAVFVSTSLGVLFNFQTTGKIVFNNTRKKLIFRFIAVYLVLYVLNLAFIQILFWLIPNFYLAGLVAIVPLALISFVLNKKLVFKESV